MNKLIKIIQEEIDRKNQTLKYVFDIEGNLIHTFKNATDAANKLGLTRRAVEAAILRKSIVGQKYYFSTDKNFVPPMKRASFNPLYRNNPSGRKGTNYRYNDSINSEEFDDL